MARDLFIPFGMRLVIGPNTSLFFERNASLVSEGSIRAIGTLEYPIIFSAAQSLWDGILLFGSQKESFSKMFIFRRSVVLERSLTLMESKKMDG